MSRSTNVRPPRFIPSIVTKATVGCRSRCVFPEPCPVSNRDVRHPSRLPAVPAVWLGSSGQSMKWEGRSSCAAELGRRCCLAGAGEQTSKIGPWWHLASMTAADLNSSQITISQGSLSFHGSTTLGPWQGSSSQLPRVPPLHPARCCVRISWPFAVTQSSRANNFRPSGNLPKSGGNSTPAQGMAVFLEKNGQKYKNLQFS